MDETDILKIISGWKGERMENMNIDEAIYHCQGRAKADCSECAEEHRQLAEWLEELKEYKRLDEQGLLLCLPCKVGDTVYHENPYASVHTGVQAYKITNIMISQNKKGEWTKKYRAMLLVDGKIVDNQLNFSFDYIGKTVFLTQAEAETCSSVTRRFLITGDDAFTANSR